MTTTTLDPAVFGTAARAAYDLALHIDAATIDERYRSMMQQAAELAATVDLLFGRLAIVVALDQHESADQ